MPILVRIILLTYIWPSLICHVCYLTNMKLLRVWYGRFDYLTESFWSVHDQYTSTSHTKGMALLHAHGTLLHRIVFVTFNNVIYHQQMLTLLYLEGWSMGTAYINLRYKISSKCRCDRMNWLFIISFFSRSQQNLAHWQTLHMWPFSHYWDIAAWFIKR